jgi:hypothetical protein
MSDTWSSRIGGRYECHLSPDLAAWFDEGIWRHSGRGEFRQSISPTALLGDHPDEIWPGMMGSDCLPILSNTAGDWFCVRIDGHNQAAQIIHWYHGGGDWIPWGDQLAQAIAFDAVAHRFPSHHQRHATPAEPTRPSSGNDALQSDPFLSWAVARLPAAIGRVIESSADFNACAATFIEHQVAEIAIRCEMSVSALWGPQPDWQAAAHQALPVTRSAPELAWAWETVGFAAARRGDLTAAVTAFRSAVECSAFTDQSIRFTTHLSADPCAKFSAAQLSRLQPSLVESSPYLQLLCQSEEQTRREQVSRYWTERGRQSMATGDYVAAYRAFVAAGWDIGTVPLESYAAILDDIMVAAEASGQTARAEVARTHRRCVQHRYRL